MIYVSLLTVIKSKLKILPLSITCDFEKAFINAVTKVFPTTVIYGCFFHYKQAVWRKIQEKMSVIYCKNEAIRKLLKLAQIIAYIPITDVDAIFKKIKESVNNSYEQFHDIMDFFKYMEETWVGFDQEVLSGRGDFISVYGTSIGEFMIVCQERIIT
ncbi:unnamed protein product [Brachionus calyciflorus]|uniref:MULE transposase domain-containing protein n=1 Tax=Brachionus calyciflorus TaxID=104777 RepID=A0A813RSX1_9BILA|nr:unnamed protein product [Brachionus calyciflorus]